MGYMKHNAIVVTSYDDKLIEEARREAERCMPGLVSPLVESITNGYTSFFVAPDGSKEGWAESDNGDIRRDKFTEWLASKAFKDGSTPLEWCEVFYGDDDKKSGVVHDAWHEPTAGEARDA